MINFLHTVKKSLLIVLCFQLVFASSIASSQTIPPSAASPYTSSYMVQKDETAARAGSVYVTPARKNEVLFKASIWGAVQSPGIHYMPIGTRLVDALSFAGGPVERANIDRITLSTHEDGKVVVHTLSIQDALAEANANPVLKPEDVVVIAEDRSMEKTTLLLQIGTFVMSAAALGLIISQSRK